MRQTWLAPSSTPRSVNTQSYWVLLPASPVLAGLSTVDGAQTPCRDTQSVPRHWPGPWVPTYWFVKRSWPAPGVGTHWFAPGICPNRWDETNQFWYQIYPSRESRRNELVDTNLPSKTQSSSPALASAVQYHSIKKFRACQPALASVGKHD